MPQQRRRGRRPTTEHTEDFCSGHRTPEAKDRVGVQAAKTFNNLVADEVWCSVVWCGVVWCGLVVVWCGVV